MESWTCPHDSEHDTCGCCMVADGRYQCDAGMAGGSGAGDGDGVDSREIRVIRGIREIREIRDYRRGGFDSHRLLADRADGVDICNNQIGAGRMAASVGGGLARGGAIDGLYLAAATMAVADGDDRAQLLSHPIAVSSVERI